MYGNTANNINFHYRTNSVKIYLKNPYFWSNFDPFSQCFGQRKFFEKDLVLSHTTSFGFLALHHAKNLEKTNNPIPRKHLDRGKDGQTLFCRTHQAIAAGPINIINETLAE